MSVIIFQGLPICKKPCTEQEVRVLTAAHQAVFSSAHSLFPLREYASKGLLGRKTLKKDRHGGNERVGYRYCGSDGHHDLHPGSHITATGFMQENGSKDDGVSSVRRRMGPDPGRFPALGSWQKH